MNEDSFQPIGEAQPINPQEGKKILKRAAAIVSVTIGSVVAFVFLQTPTRLAGATRSARLLWQTRQNEISDVIRCEREMQQNARPPANAETDIDAER